MTVGAVLSEAANYLGRKGVETPRLDAELLLGKALGLSRIELYTGHDRPLNEPELEACRELLRRRGRREPLAYVLGEWGFRRLTLRVDSRALVPRPETEVVVDRCLALIEGIAEPLVLDLGTGSGAIALALADEHPDVTVVALERSPEALALAAENVAAHGLEGRVALRHGDFDSASGSFDLVVSNPPYVAAHELADLQPEVRDWEPREALLGGLDVVDRIAVAAARTLRGGGWVVLEVHAGHADDVVQRLRSCGYSSPRVTNDLAGRQRVVEAQWPT